MKGHREENGRLKLYFIYELCGLRPLLLGHHKAICSRLALAASDDMGLFS